MGDRACVALLHPQPIYLSTYFHGATLPQRIAQGLYDGRHRWSMPSYLTRFIVSAVMGYEEREDDGFSIGLELPHVSIGTEKDRPLIVVNMQLEHVGFAAWGQLEVAEKFSYDAFIGAGTWP